MDLDKERQIILAAIQASKHFKQTFLYKKSKTLGAKVYQNNPNKKQYDFSVKLFLKKEIIVELTEVFSTKETKKGSELKVKNGEAKVKLLKESRENLRNTNGKVARSDVEVVNSFSYLENSINNAIERKNKKSYINIKNKKILLLHYNSMLANIFDKKNYQKQKIDIYEYQVNKILNFNIKGFEKWDDILLLVNFNPNCNIVEDACNVVVLSLVKRNNIKFEEVRNKVFDPNILELFYNKKTQAMILFNKK